MIDLSKNCDSSKSGIIFKLQDKSSIQGKILLNDAAHLKLSKNSKYIYLNFNHTQNDPHIFDPFEEAQKSLDYLSIKGIQNSSIKTPIDHYILWSLEENYYCINIIESSFSKFTLSPVGDYNLSLSEYHPSFRFFRVAQTANDLFDSYRNLWLSFESLATQHTQAKKGESELDWYTRSLKHLSDVYQSKELDQLLQKTTAEDIMRKLYTDTRCALFHSKNNRDHYLPHTTSDYDHIRTSLRELTIVVLAYFHHFYSITSKNSWLNPEVLSSTDKLFENSRLFLSHSSKEESLGEDELNHLLESYPSSAVRIESRKTDTFVSLRLVSDLKNDPTSKNSVQRFSFINITDKQELLIFTLDEELSLYNVSSIRMDTSTHTPFLERPPSYLFTPNLI